MGATPFDWRQDAFRQLLCALVMFLDGFDTQAISYMAPLIAKEWGFSGNYWDRFSRRRWPG
jgi:hypothetical protein